MAKKKNAGVKYFGKPPRARCAVLQQIQPPSTNARRLIDATWVFVTVPTSLPILVTGPSSWR
jgi:hypothetical protein